MKNGKRIVLLLLVIVMVLSVVPLYTQAAKPKLNKTSKTMYAETWYTLKVKNYNSSKVVWSSSNEKVAKVYSGCLYAVAEGKATITARCGKKKLKCKVTVKYTTKQKIKAISDWYIGEIWNDGITVMRDYANNKEGVNVEYTLNKLKKNYKKMESYNTFMEGLSDSKYSDLKEVWTLIKNESDKHYNSIMTFDWNNFQTEEEWEDAYEAAEYADGFPKWENPVDTTLLSTYVQDYYSLVN
ncbi:MAG: Ig-like domain-containing protein [Lachnospiraceae bacterium]|nr:Ig-like domain-containing protein [Lachnospiraceae bacterium]